MKPSTSSGQYVLPEPMTATVISFICITPFLCKILFILPEYPVYTADNRLLVEFYEPKLSSAHLLRIVVKLRDINIVGKLCVHGARENDFYLVAVKLHLIGKSRDELRSALCHLVGLGERGCVALAAALKNAPMRVLI